MKFSELGGLLGLDRGGADGDPVIRGVGPLEGSAADCLSYVAEARFAALLPETRAAAVICTAAVAAGAPVPCLVSHTPAADFARASRMFADRPRVGVGVHPTAVVEPGARVSDSARIGPFVVVGEGAVVEDGAELHAHVVLYKDARIGRDTLVYAGAVIRERCRVGERCVIHPNVVVGSDGFGFARREDGGYEKIEQMGSVEIGDDVEIGSGSTVDRATFGTTTIGRGTKIDNLVQVGHNCTIGEHTILCAQVGLAGSSRVGSGVTLAGQVGVAGHLTIGDNVVATAQTGIPSSVDAAQIVSGYPAINNRQWLKSSAIFARLPEIQTRLRHLERRVASIEIDEGPAEAQ